MNALPEPTPYLKRSSGRHTYLKAKKTYSDDMLQFLSGGFTAGVLGIYEREKIGANFLFGSFYFESLTLPKPSKDRISKCRDGEHAPTAFSGCRVRLHPHRRRDLRRGDLLNPKRRQVGSLVAQEVGKYINIGDGSWQPHLTHFAGRNCGAREVAAVKKTLPL